MRTARLALEFEHRVGERNPEVKIRIAESASLLDLDKDLIIQEVLDEGDVFVLLAGPSGR